MNLLFESYVYDYLKRKGGFENIKNQDKKHYLAYENEKGRFALKPDIVIDEGKIIVDTKWKILSESKSNQGISQSDIYQLYAYGTKYETCEKLYLIYPKDEVELGNLYHYYEDKELLLKVLFFDVENLENNKNFIL
jgi:5-methylcytosine-specific restriction enzyme subunit McrC